MVKMLTFTVQRKFGSGKLGKIEQVQSESYDTLCYDLYGHLSERSNITYIVSLDVDGQHLVNRQIDEYFKEKERKEIQEKTDSGLCLCSHCNQWKDKVGSNFIFRGKEAICGECQQALLFGVMRMFKQQEEEERW